jgi:hypothetical protein
VKGEGHGLQKLLVRIGVSLASSQCQSISLSHSLPFPLSSLLFCFLLFLAFSLPPPPLITNTQSTQPHTTLLSLLQAEAYAPQSGCKGTPPPSRASTSCWWPAVLAKINVCMYTHVYIYIYIYTCIIYNTYIHKYMCNLYNTYIYVYV